jgi:hypothetical protein
MDTVYKFLFENVGPSFRFSEVDMDFRYIYL